MKLFSEKRRHFPDPRLANRDGIVAIGDHLDTEILLEAYSFGIFPWPHEEYPLLWFSPDPRGVLDFADLKIPRSLAKKRKKQNLKVTTNRAFESVIRACAHSHRPGQDGTWITEPMIRAYIEFHRAGYAHSVEAWIDDQLVGGVYGVYVAGVFSGESMFYTESDASKICLLHIIDNLQSQGLSWMDIQMVTPNLEALGGKYIDREDYLDRVEECKRNAKPIVWK
ncbi:MAG: leucyl/phenylalanyl-tRNA--protein transferase [Pseudobdellovibrionaceae bacterium]|nr:leucyl/phenylalanyl-tRNA--protein transferase [Bdellovibrionales bacterium]USN46102.1 MAG: leucyl/phenylalanyl-tRNA--protein transferase [Pseudobdellovibrionaceae bacterium]